MDIFHLGRERGGKRPVPLRCHWNATRAFPRHLYFPSSADYFLFFFSPFYSGNIARTQHCDTRLGIDSASVRCQCGASAVPEAQLNQR